MGEKPIYEIYVYSQEWTLDEHGFFEYGTSERVGFYYEKEVAIQAIEENWCDLQDHYARAAMMKEVRPGLYPCITPSKCQYYIWNSQKEKFEKAKVPEADWWKE